MVLLCFVLSSLSFFVHVWSIFPLCTLNTAHSIRNQLIPLLARFSYVLWFTSVFTLCCVLWFGIILQWRHNERNGASHHRRLDCLLNRLFGRRSKKTSKLRVTGFCEGNPPVRWLVDYLRFPHNGPVTRKMFPFGDVIMGRNHPCHKAFTCTASMKAIVTVTVESVNLAPELCL